MTLRWTWCWVVALLLVSLVPGAAAQSKECHREIYTGPTPYNMLLIARSPLSAFFQRQFDEMLELVRPSNGVAVVFDVDTGLDAFMNLVDTQQIKHVVSATTSRAFIHDAMISFNTTGKWFPYTTMMDDPGFVSDLFNNRVQVVSFRDDHVGFFAGVVAGATSSHRVAALFGFGISPLRRFRQGFASGLHTTCPSCTLDAVYHHFRYSDSAVDYVREFVRRGADVVFAAAGGEGSAAIADAARRAALNETHKVLVIGVDSDEYYGPLFQSDATARPFLLGSAVKRAEVGIRCSFNDAVTGQWTPGVRVYSAENGGVSFSPCHEACDKITPKVRNEIDHWTSRFKTGSIPTNVNLDGGWQLDWGTSQFASFTPMFGDEYQTDAPIVFCGGRVHFAGPALATPAGPQEYFFGPNEQATDTVMVVTDPVTPLDGSTTVCTLPARVADEAPESWMILFGGLTKTRVVSSTTTAKGLHMDCYVSDTCGYDITYMGVAGHMLQNRSSPRGTPLPPLDFEPVPRHSHVAATVADVEHLSTRSGNRMFIAGGIASNGRQLQDLHECRLGPQSDTETHPFRCTWYTHAALPGPLPPHAMTAHVTQRLEEGPHDGTEWLLVMGNTTREYALYNIQADTWVTRTALNDPPQGVHPHCFVSLGKRVGVVVHMPREDGQPGSLVSLWTFSPARNRWALAISDVNELGLPLDRVMCTVEPAARVLLEVAQQFKTDAHKVYYYTPSSGTGSMRVVLHPSLTCDQRRGEGLDSAGLRCIRCPEGLYAMGGECHTCTPTSNASVAFGCLSGDSSVDIKLIVIPVAVFVFVLGIVITGILRHRANHRRDSRMPENAPQGDTDIPVLVVSVVDALTLWQKHPSAMGKATVAFHSVVSMCTAAHHGYEVGTAGDTVVVVTSTPVQAVRIAADLIRARASPQWPKGFYFDIGVAIDFGKVSVKMNGPVYEYAGMTLSTAGSLARATAPGQILLSQNMALVSREVSDHCGVRLSHTFQVERQGKPLTVVEVVVPDAKKISSRSSRVDSTTFDNDETATMDVTEDLEDHPLVTGGTLDLRECQYIHAVITLILTSMTRIQSRSEQTAFLQTVHKRFHLRSEMQRGAVLHELSSRLLQTLDLIELKIAMETFVEETERSARNPMRAMASSANSMTHSRSVPTAELEVEFDEPGAPNAPPLE